MPKHIDDIIDTVSDEGDPTGDPTGDRLVSEPSAAAIEDQSKELTPAQHALVEANVKLAYYLAMKHCGPEDDLDELKQVAIMQLIGCAKRFDPERGVPFGSYAGKSIRLTLQRYLTQKKAKEARTVSMDAAAGGDGEDEDDGDSTLHDVMSGGGDALAGVMTGEQSAALRRAVEELPERLRDVLIGLYWEDRPLRDLCVDFGVSHTAVANMHAKALEALRKLLLKRGIRSFSESVSESTVPGCTAAEMRSDFLQVAAAVSKAAQGGVKF